MDTRQRALLIIDIQNDYFDQGSFPLANAEATLDRIEHAISQAQAQDIPVILVQHQARSAQAGFFRPGTPGVALHPRLLAAAPNAPVVVKHFADSFHQTELGALLERLQIRELLLCGMMTQNCVTHTALSPAAAGYQVHLLPDCCTTVSQALHEIALNALVTRPDVHLSPASEALA